MIDYDKWMEYRAEWSDVKRYEVEGFSMHPNSGNGDFFYNTCRSIIEKNDKSDRAHEILEEVFFWLNLGYRWPDWADYLITTTNHTQTQMTQDPWIMAYCCAVHLDRIDLIEKCKPSLRIFNLPDKWAWRRALLGKPNLYWLWRTILPYNWMQGFVYVFYGFMDQAYLK